MLEMRFHDLSTGEITDRQMSAEEKTLWELGKSESKVRQAEADAKVAARESALQKLALLGLTADEVAAL